MKIFAVTIEIDFYSKDTVSLFFQPYMKNTDYENY